LVETTRPVLRRHCTVVYLHLDPNSFVEITDVAVTIIMLTMGDDDETHLHVTYASHLNMDVAFCGQLRAAGT
jgi:hypothetical protein